MKELLISLFGVYTPVTTHVPSVVTNTTIETITSADGVATTIENALSRVELTEVVASGLAGVDWPWVAGVFLFAVVLWSFFRLVGVLLRG